MPPVVRAVGSGDSPFSPPGFAAVQVGLNYICATAERFFAVGAVLGSMVQMLVREHSPPRVDNARVSCGAYLTSPSAMSHTWQASTLCSRVSPSAPPAERLPSVVSPRADGAAVRAAAEAHHPVLPAAVGQPEGARGAAPVPPRAAARPQLHRVPQGEKPTSHPRSRPTRPKVVLELELALALGLQSAGLGHVYARVRSSSLVLALSPRGPGG
jgi:hypothetical protein